MEMTDIGDLLWDRFSQQLKNSIEPCLDLCQQLIILPIFFSPLIYTIISVVFLSKITSYVPSMDDRILHIWDIRRYTTLRSILHSWGKSKHPSDIQTSKRIKTKANKQNNNKKKERGGKNRGRSSNMCDYIYMLESFRSYQKQYTSSFNLF